jgi:hypothetical protein
MAAPAVQNLQDIIGQISAAYQPQKDLIDQSIKANDTSGTAQVAGLGAKKDQAFSDITQKGNDRGMFFSGFAPDQQAKYTGSTYLPALANLQNTIASTRNSLLGKKAGLDTAANTQAFTVHEGQVKGAQAWQDQQDAAARAEAARVEGQNFQASQNALNRQATLNAASVRAANAKQPQPTAADIKRADSGAIAGSLSHATGKDGYVSPASYAAAKNDWVGQGYSSQEFDNAYSNFRNPKNPYYKVG